MKKQSDFFDTVLTMYFPKILVTREKRRSFLKKISILFYLEGRQLEFKTQAASTSIFQRLGSKVATNQLVTAPPKQII
jgi:hypothetical protein